MKLIIDIPEEVYKKAKETHDVMCDKVWLGIKYGTPLDTVKAEIKEKCDSIDDIVRANMYQYAPHREIQDLLCEILDTFDKHIGEDKE